MAERLLKALGGVFLLVGIKLPIGRIKRLTMALSAAFFTLPSVLVGKAFLGQFLHNGE